MTDLDLVSLEDLIDEIEKRSKAFILSYLADESGGEIIRTRWTEDHRYTDVLGLCEIVKRDIQRSVEGAGEDED